MSMKQKIIHIVGRMKNMIGEDALGKLFDSSDRATGENKVGCNQFREIAADCRSAECYEEIVLLIRYTQSKSRKNASWKTICANGKSFGEVVLDGMAEVRNLCDADADWEQLWEPIQLFFGYLYWQSRIWADQYAKNDSNGNQNRNGNPYYQKRGNYNRRR